jgi:hypothetical protein
MRALIHITFFCLLSSICFGQNARLKGSVVHGGEPLLDAEITIPATGYSSFVDFDGNFNIEIPANQDITFIFTSTDFQEYEITVNLKVGETKKLKVRMRPAWQVTVDKYLVHPGLDTIPRLKPGDMTSPMGNFEDLLKTAGIGVSSSNELSSGYNVRGGNFDENLIYVNDVEIYRPFLARSGQQEGLSFINPSMISNIRFSAGGFEARYGDKMSSVLDITYLKPQEFGGIVSASLLGGDLQFGNRSKNNLWTYSVGTRYRANGYLFNSLPTKGQYRPVFADFQTRITHNRGQWEHSFMGYAALNKYRVVPENSESEFGTVNEALRLRVFFEGQEISQFNTYLGAFRSKYVSPDTKTNLRFVASTFRTIESEKFDILGQYFLDELERDISSEEFGESAYNRGVGSYIEHARNELDATVFSFAHKGEHRFDKWSVLWGGTYKHERINDKLSEWNMLDSSGFSIPTVTDSVGFQDPSAQEYQLLELFEVIKAKNQISSNRVQGYLQGNFNLHRSKDITFSGPYEVGDSTYKKDTSFTSNAYFKINAGVRTHYWDYNGQNVISPRLVLEYKPRLYFWEDEKLYRRSSSIRLSVGQYAQPAFYREYRDFNGDLNPEIRAQKSVHFVLGADYIFNMWNRKFKYTVEGYYKHLTDIVPYEIDNVKLRYFAENNAVGYAYGLDMKINGEFIKGIESWVTFGYLKTEEDIQGDYYYNYYNSDGEEILVGFTANSTVADSQFVEPGYIPRPTDQRVSVGLYFQDHMPKDLIRGGKFKWETLSVNLNIVFGTALPYGPPNHERWRDVLRTPPYRRVDIGFAKDILSQDQKDRKKDGSFIKKIAKMKLSVEVFNLLDINNVVSYNWIKDVSGRSYAVPSYLTSRRLNVRLTTTF